MIGVLIRRGDLDTDTYRRKNTDTQGEESHLHAEARDFRKKANLLTPYFWTSSL